MELQVCGTPFEGYEWYEAQLRDRAGQPDLAGAVTFLGYVSPVWPTLAEADAFVATSLVRCAAMPSWKPNLLSDRSSSQPCQGMMEQSSMSAPGCWWKGRTRVLLLRPWPGLMDDPDLAARLAHRGRSEGTAAILSASLPRATVVHSAPSDPGSPTLSSRSVHPPSDGSDICRPGLPPRVGSGRGPNVTTNRVVPPHHARRCGHVTSSPGYPRAGGPHFQARVPGSGGL